MVLYNLYLVLIHEEIVIYDNDIQRVVYEGYSENIPSKLMNALVHDMTMAYDKHINRACLLININ